MRLGELYTWSDIVYNYPNKCVFITDVLENEDGIKLCRLIGVCNLMDEMAYSQQLRMKGISFRCEHTIYSYKKLQLSFNNIVDGVLYAV